MKYAVGLLSGTSADGIDVALVAGSIRRPRIVEAMTRPFDPSTRRRVLEAGTLDAGGIARLDRALGEEFAAAVLALLRRAGVKRTRVRIIGSHGQTVFHEPRVATLQLGSPAIIAERTGIPVAGDFRQEDVAAGGEGAPLMPLLDAMLLERRSRKRRIASLNLGGIANVTLVKSGRVIAAYDIGPANTLIDLAARRRLGRSCDRGGRTARKGRADEVWLAKALDHDFFRRAAPKSTGPELFGPAWLEGELSAPTRKTTDVLATLTEFTARSVARDLQALRAEEVFVSGGGVRNGFLRRRLAALIAPVPLRSWAARDIAPDHKEALLFAWLGEMRRRGEPVDLRAVTGARRPKVLGGLWLP